MSKQSEAKAAQDYDPNPVQRMCSNCKNFTSEKTERTGVFGGIYVEEKEKRCGIGGFAVKKTATCAKFDPKEFA